MAAEELEGQTKVSGLVGHQGGVVVQGGITMCDSQIEIRWDIKGSHRVHTRV